MLIRHILIISFLFLIGACKSNNNTDPRPKPGKDLRVLGYYHSQGTWNVNDIEAQIPLLTDLNLAFINPGTNGSFNDYPGLTAFVETVQRRNLRVFLSFGGGSAPAHLAELIKPANRTAFIESIRTFMLLHKFDGVDVDLENELINEDYAGFVTELSVAIKASNKLMTAALASWNANQITDETMRLYDFINVMSYDKTGPWNLANPGQHSPYDMAESDFLYFNQTRGIAASKLFIGLPFYGYGFGGSAPQSMTYGNIVSTYPGTESKDEHRLPDGGTIYYNGQPTIQRKTAYAIQQKAGGVMIWQIRGDATGNKSLLRAIQTEKEK